MHHLIDGQGRHARAGRQARETLSSLPSVARGPPDFSSSPECSGKNGVRRTNMLPCRDCCFPTNPQLSTRLQDRVILLFSQQWSSDRRMSDAEQDRGHKAPSRPGGQHIGPGRERPWSRVSLSFVGVAPNARSSESQAPSARRQIELPSDQFDYSTTRATRARSLVTLLSKRSKGDANSEYTLP
jgi:hypothetical protein